MRVSRRHREMRRVRRRKTGTELSEAFLVGQFLCPLGLHELLMLLRQERLCLLLLLEINLMLDFLHFLLDSKRSSFLIMLCGREGVGVNHWYAGR